jgi:hypothetical protein
LNLRAAVQAGGVVTGSDDFFAGAGEQGGGSKDTLRPTQEVIRGKVVPALKRILKEERNNNILSGAMVALAKIGDDPKAESGKSEMAAELIRFLGDPTQEVAETMPRRPTRRSPRSIPRSPRSRARSTSATAPSRPTASV